MAIVMPEYMPASHHCASFISSFGFITLFLLIAGFGNQFIFGYEVEVELSIQLENGNGVEYE